MQEDIMPVEFDYENGIVYGAFKSPLNLDEIKQAIALLTQSAQFSADADTLWDLRALDFTQINNDMERQLVAIRTQYPERGQARIAFVVDTDLGFGMMRRYEMLSADLPQQIRVFRDYAKADAWLSLRKEVMK